MFHFNGFSSQQVNTWQVSPSSLTKAHFLGWRCTMINPDEAVNMERLSVTTYTPVTNIWKWYGALAHPIPGICVLVQSIKLQYTDLQKNRSIRNGDAYTESLAGIPSWDYINVLNMPVRNWALHESIWLQCNTRSTQLPVANTFSILKYSSKSCKCYLSCNTTSVSSTGQRPSPGAEF